MPLSPTYSAQTLGLPSLSFETPYQACGKTVLTRELYREPGRRLAQAVLAPPAVAGA